MVHLSSQPAKSLGFPSNGNKISRMASLEMESTGIHSVALPIQTLVPPLLSTIFSFIDFPTIANVLCRVCKQWRDACHNPLAFADQRLILNAPPTIVARWAPCFSMVNSLQLTDKVINAESLSSLTPHISRIQHLRFELISRDTAMHEERCRCLPRFSQGFFALTRLHIFCQLPQDAEAALLGCFSSHFPRLQRFKYYNYSVEARQPGALPLASLLASLTQATHLAFESKFMLRRLSDQLLLDVAKQCPRVTHLNLSPYEYSADTPTPGEYGGGLPLIGDIASAFSHLSTIYLDSWFLPRSQLSILLDKCPTITHLHLPYPCQYSPFASTDVNTVLAYHANLTRLTIQEAHFSGRTLPYYSPHIRIITIHTPFEPDIAMVHKYLTHNPALTECTVVMPKTDKRWGRLSCEQFADTKRRFPNIKRLVWERGVFFRSSAQEARYVEGNGDPRVYRVFF